jgi:hypothetical protein
MGVPKQLSSFGKKTKKERRNILMDGDSGSCLLLFPLLGSLTQRSED